MVSSAMFVLAHILGVEKMTSTTGNKESPNTYAPNLRSNPELVIFESVITLFPDLISNGHPRNRYLPQVL